ncbi:MAG: DUF4395 family protein [Chloroflexi bacterium]|nr:MAG: DUF4395 family protein [Chloroflexota bacterium]NOH13022.1 DUF4395 family protein [Chloroflexota bacterium]
MATLRIPTPLRPYTDNQSEVAVSASNVSGALDQLTEAHPALAQHLFTEEGQLRSFVNLFLNDEDVRYLDGVETELKEDDRLMIIPSIAGGSEALAKVDHSALRVNQAFIIGLNIIAFILNGLWLAAIVTFVMVVGSLLRVPGFGFIYKSLLKPAGFVKPDVISDNPEPHRFAQGFGAVVMLGAIISLFAGAFTLGWGLVWLVVALAALNLFAGFCVGCAVYYWLNRLGLPGFVKAPPQDVFPGARPKRQVS